MKTNWLTATFLTILLVSMATPLIARSASAHEGDDDHDLEREDIGQHWKAIKTDIITVLFPRGGSKPMFLWWYTQDPSMIYVVKYQGLIEYFAFEHRLLGVDKPEYYRRIREAWHERFEDMYMKPEEQRWSGDWMKMWLLGQIMQQIEERWHRPFLPFDAGRWTLGDFTNITTPEGKTIGVSFAFTLVDLPDEMPNLQFAENNIKIRVRFYNETVEETVPGTDFSYKVNAGEMKMDFVVNKWVWNIDTIKQLVLQLRNAGFNITIPEGKSRLALWVNLTSINMTKLLEVEDHPEEIEHIEVHPESSTSSHMEIEDTHEDIRANKTETEQEKPIEIQRPAIKIRFANETKTFGGFFRFVSSAKITDYPNQGDVNMVPVKAAYIAGGAHMRLFIGYPYFGNGTLEHDPSIGVEVPNVGETTPKYIVQAPSGMSETPVVLGKYVLPLFTTELMVALIAVVSATAIILYAAKWKRKTPVNMVGAAGPTG